SVPLLLGQPAASVRRYRRGGGPDPATGAGGDPRTAAVRGHCPGVHAGARRAVDLHLGGMRTLGCRTIAFGARAWAPGCACWSAGSCLDATSPVSLRTRTR